MAQPLATEIEIFRTAFDRLLVALDRPASDEGSALNLAERELARRKRRGNQLPAGLLGEPAWDLMLVLFIAFERQEVLHLSTAFRQAGVAPTTGLRVIERLEGYGLAERPDLGRLGRSQRVQLTAAGVAKIRGAVAGKEL